MTLSPFVIQQERRPFELVPFLGYEAQVRPETAISHAVELSLAFFPIGFALAFALPRRQRWPLAAFIVVALGGVLEYLQGWIVGRYPDVTDVGVLALGAMAGVWAASHALADRYAERSGFLKPSLASSDT
jgi:glycopeptide antibiotics resistance protein